MKNGTKNKLIDLNNHLFAQMERLSEVNGDEMVLKGDGLAEELKRAKAIGQVATQIINNAKLSLDAYKAINDGLIKDAPPMLGMKSANVEEE